MDQVCGTYGNTATQPPITVCAKMMRFLLLLFALTSERFVVVVSAASVGNSECIDGYSAVGDRCLLFFTFAEQPYKEAVQTCHAAQGKLASILTTRQFMDVLDHINNYGYRATFWLDGTDEEQEGNWRTSLGEAVPRGTPFWGGTVSSQQQPDNARGIEHCLDMGKGMYYYMNDAACNTSMNFICEFTGQSSKADAMPVFQVNSTDSPPPPSTSIVGRSGCPLFYVDVGGLCMMFVTWAEVSWAEASQTCGDFGELLSIHDPQILREVVLYLNQEEISSHSFWLGGTDSEKEGTWVYTTGEPVPMGTPYWGILHENGHTQEPSGGQQENCLWLDAGGYHYFRDTSCSNKANPLCVYIG